MTLLLALLACGFDGDLETPSPPPSPPPTLSAQAADVIVHTGVVSDVSAATRSFASSGEGRRLVCVLSANAVLEVDGQVAQLTEVLGGRTVTVEGREVGDVVLVSRATVAPLPLDAGDTPPAAPAAPDAASPPPVAPTGSAPPGSTPPGSTPPAASPTPPSP